MYSKLYQENDKVMLLDTGEVLTVVADFSEHLERGIIVQENILQPLKRCEVRPAGATRERFEASSGISAPDSPAPRPANSLF